MADDDVTADVGYGSTAVKAHGPQRGDDDDARTPKPFVSWLPCMPKLAVVHAMLCMAQLASTSYTITTKLALKDDHVNPLIFSFYRDAIAYPVLQTLCLVYDGRVALAWRDVPRVAFLGLTGMFGNQFLFVMGLDLTNADFAVIMQQVTPVITCVVAISVGMERLSLGKAAGILLCVGGALGMVGVANLTSSGSKNFVFGTLALLGNSLCSALYALSQKPLLLKYPPLSLTAWSYGFGALLMGLSTLYYCDQPKEFAVEPKVALALAVAVVGNSVIKYTLNSIANKHVSATVLNLWQTGQVVFVAVGAWLFLHTQLLARYAWGVAILVGLGVVVRDRTKEPFAAKAARMSRTSESEGLLAPTSEEEWDGAADNP